MRSLLKDTMVYGISTTVGKFLNWLLTFLYARVLLISQFGEMSNLYAWTAIFMIILTYGMETGFFRFANKRNDPMRVYSTTLWTIGTTSILFFILLCVFLPQISEFLELSDHKEYVLAMGGVVALDAFMSIPLAYLRYASKAWKFFYIRMSFIGITILSTVVIFVVLPWLSPSLSINGAPLSIENRLKWVFLINLGSNVIQLILLMPYVLQAGRTFDIKILKDMLAYSWPMLLLGLAGSFNNQADKILFPRMFDNIQEGNYQLGIYSACYKLALVMVLFTQAFRYAYDPFVYSQTKNGDHNGKDKYSLAMRYYVISTLLIFLFVMTSMDFLKYFVPESYYGGLSVVPYIMVGQLMFGVYSNLSVWYKVTDRTVYGALFSIIGCTITSAVIYFFAVRWGSMACAWASVISNAIIMSLSYIIGQRFYKINYNLNILAKYVVLTAVAVALQYCFAQYFPTYLSIMLKWMILVLYVMAIVKLELKKGSISAVCSKVPFFRKFLRNNR